MDEKHYNALQARLAEIEKEKQGILRELASFKKEKPAGPCLGTPVTALPPETPEQKVDLFLKLFRCRSDVYPKLWENTKRGTKGYSPVCANEWDKNVCGKPEIRCLECDNQAFMVLDEKAARDHLEGKITIGTYTIRKDDSCIFLAADFDKGDWHGDALAYRDAAGILGVEVHIERSRSGKGAHAWIFFSEAVQAHLARQLGTIILSQASTDRLHIGLDSYDRFFPSQDTLPKGGFGNLIALPLQYEPRSLNNSVFVDDDLNPHKDQWLYLSRVKALSNNDLLKLLKDYTLPAQAISGRNPEVIKIMTDEYALNAPFMKMNDIYKGVIKLELDKQVSLDIKPLPSRLTAALKRIAVIANPKFYELQRLRFSTWNTPRYIASYKPEGNILRLPRGTLDECVRVLKNAGSDIEIIDKRRRQNKRKFKFTGTLSREQKKAVNEITAHDTGVLVAPPGAGKTVMACAVIGKRKVPVLVLVHRKQLAEQWKIQLAKFLSLAKNNIGVLGTKRKANENIVTVGMLQTLARRKSFEMIKGEFGMVIIDECHHVPAVSFETVLKEIPARYILGLTATPYRKDGLQAIIHMQCGPTRYTVEETAALAGIDKKVIVRETGFNVPDTTGLTPGIHEIWDLLVKDSNRLDMIAGDVISCLKDNRFPLILSERKDHLELLMQRIKDMIPCDGNVKGFLLSGTMGKKERKKVFNEINDAAKQGIKPFIIATGSLIGEGFDLPGLCVLFLAMPISFKGRIVQYAGRLHRDFPGKTEVFIYDYLDSRLGLAMSMFRKRLVAYKKLGYDIQLPVNSSVKIRGNLREGIKHRISAKQTRLNL